MTTYRNIDTRKADGVYVSFSREEAFDQDATPHDYLDTSNDDDAARIEAWRDGCWHFVGIRAKATILIVRNGHGVFHEMTSAGLWGIESDSGEEYFAEVFREECEALKADIAALGSLAIHYA